MPPKDKINRQILAVNKYLTMRMHVMLKSKTGRGFSQEMKYFHKEFIGQGGSGIGLDIVSYITLEYRNDEPWNSSKTFTINQRNLHNVMVGLQKMQRRLYAEDLDIFTVNKKEELFINNELAQQNAIVISDKLKQQFIRIVPALVFDDADKSYEGVTMYINNPDNAVNIMIDAFDALVMAVSNIDLFVYSQMLVNYYVAYMASLNEAVEIEHAAAPNHYGGRQPIQPQEKPTTSNLPPKAKDVFGL